MPSVIFAPLLPLPWLAAAGVLSVALLGFSAYRRRRAPVNEAAVLAALALVLAHPQKITETRIPEKDQVLVITDGSASQTLEERRIQTEQADTALHAALRPLASEIETVFRQLPAEEGTPVFSTLQKMLEEVDASRLSAVLLITDGQATDGPSEISLPAPLHVLLTGNQAGFDRRLEVKQAPVYGIVGKTAPVTFRVMDDGGVPAKEAAITLTADGETIASLNVTPGKQATFEIPIRHAGDMTVMISTPGVGGEVTERNNRQAFTVRGVRERLRVLLVSGEANIGQRTWRNILKSDPAVDLVHFTILRNPQSVDRTPPSEMSLIPFPVEDLFSKKLDGFDLIVFDHFGQNGLLPSRYLENIAKHVRKKAGLLYVSAP
ncbi:MAG: hypothetical protein J0L97_01390 [Alphaproteobacteria bacterium]|nr:hypothetical protein [Alphaproteobacteria bacterium]